MENKIIISNNSIRHINYNKLGKRLKKSKKSVLDILKLNIKKNPQNNFLGVIKNNKVEYETYKTIYKKIRKLAFFLQKKTENKDYIGLFSINRPEWIISEHAGYLINCINIPINPILDYESILNILKETELKIIISSGESAKSLFENILSKNKTNLKYIILMDESQELIENFEKINIEVFLFKDIMKLKKYKKIIRKSAGIDDIATINYTSGTSGNPKGVVLTHKNFISLIYSYDYAASSDDFIKNTSKDIYFSYLPLSHVFERLCISLCLYKGCKICFYSGNIKNFSSDLQIVKPSLISAVPRVLNVITSKIKEEISKKNIFIRIIIFLLIQYKILLQKKLIYKSEIIDKLVFNKIKSKFSENIRYILYGSAQMPAKNVKFLQTIFSCPIKQGYGQTETLAANFIQPLTCPDIESIGIPYPNTKFKIIKKKKYPKNTGLLLIKSYSMTKEYFKNPEKTKKLFNKNNWLITNDLVRIENNLVYFVSRMSQIFKTGYGEFILPEKLENLYIGENINDICALPVEFSDFFIFVVYCSNLSLNKEDIKNEINNKAKDLLNKGKIKRYEIPKDIILINVPFIELSNGNLVTVSLKKKHNLIKDFFKNEVEIIKTKLNKI